MGLKTSSLKATNYLTIRDDVQVTPDATGVELNNPDEFSDSTSKISISRIKLGPNSGFEKHAHPHNHVLIIIEGSGFLVYKKKDGIEEQLNFTKGDVFNVPGLWEHAVTAGPNGVLMFSIGSPPMHLIDPERMVFLEEKHQWMVPERIDHKDT